MSSKATYQDVWLRGNKLSSGQRVCAERYDAIKPFLDRFQRPFTLLDIGASEGYFTLRIAEDFPESVVVAIEKRPEKLLELCKLGAYDNVILLDYAVTVDDLERLSSCEHFDVVLCLNVLHHFDVSPNDVRRLVSAATSLGDVTLIETPHSHEQSAHGEFRGNELVQPLDIALSSNQFCSQVGSYSSHVQDIDRYLWKHETTRIGLKRSFFDKPDNVSQSPITIESGTKFKHITVGDRGPVDFIHGINLRTYQCLGGVWPSRPKLTEFLGQIQIEQVDQAPHNDVRPWNFILSGKRLRLIDGGDDQSIYDDELGFDTLADDLQNTDGYAQYMGGADIREMSVDEWLRVGIRQLAVLTPFRNARKHLRRYFDQLAELDKHLRMKIRLVAAEGDSTDGTADAIIEYARAYNVDLELINTSHGKGPWGSVEDPHRLQCMSDVMNAALDCVNDTDTHVMWIMSDIEYDAEMIATLVESVERETILAPMPFSRGTDVFWDTYEFVGLDGEGFTNKPPYHISLEDPDEFIEIQSAGTCLVMRSENVKHFNTHPLEGISFCASAREHGYDIYTSKSWRINHMPLASKRLLWLGDFMVTTGSARVPLAVLPQLSEMGYEIDIIAINYPCATPHKFPWRIWSANMPRDESPESRRGIKRLYELLQYNQYDLFVVFGDVWDGAAAGQVISRDDVNRPKHCLAWLTVDSYGHQGGEELAKFDHIVSCSQFGAKEIETLLYRSGDPKEWNDKRYPSIVPLGVDTRVFNPNPKLKDSFLKQFPDFSDKFIVANVAKNQWRKRLDLTIATFARFVEKSNSLDAVLLLYTKQDTLASRPIDIYACADFYGVSGRVYVNNDVMTDSDLALVYNSMDVFLSTSLGEGFCIPVLEAMACGVPVIAPNHTGYDWSSVGAKLVSCKTVASPCGPLNQPSYTYGYEIDVTAAANVLTWLYHNPPSLKQLKANNARQAVNFDWREISNKFAAVVEHVTNEGVGSRHKSESSSAIEGVDEEPPTMEPVTAAAR